jgi:hypothetical protein
MSLKASDLYKRELLSVVSGTRSFDKVIDNPTPYPPGNMQSQPVRYSFTMRQVEKIHSQKQDHDTLMV